MSNLERAIEVAFMAHKGQKDKGGNPYILHPLRVMMLLDSEAEKIVGVLHDVAEVRSWAFAELQLEGFSGEVPEALASVTKREGDHGTNEACFRFVERAKQNPVARKVKNRRLAGRHGPLETARGR